MNKNTIKIAFKGQLYKTDASSANYVYPQGNSDWASISESDPRTVLSQLNINGNFPCYTIFITESSVIYAFRRTLSGRANSNCVMVMLCAGGPTNNGKQLVKQLQELLTIAVSQTSFDQVNKTVLEEKLKSCEEFFDWQKKPNAKTKETSKIKEGYRFYTNNEELYELLEKPYQPVYKNYRCIHIVPEEANAKIDKNVNQNENDSLYHLITSPIETIYYINLPQGVYEKDGKKHVSRNEAFTLIYRREGYNDEESGTQYVSQSSKYFAVSDDTINVYDAEKCGIKFKRSITIFVEDELGNPIKEWNHRMNNNNKWNTCHDESKFSLADGEYSISIAADGYNPTTFTFDTRRKQSFCVSLTSKDFKRKIILKPAWPKKKKIPKHYIEEPITIVYTANTTLYKQYNNALDPAIRDIPTFYVTTKKPKPILITLCIISVLIGCILGLGVGYLEWNNKKTSKDNDVIEKNQEQLEAQYIQPNAPESTETPEEHDVAYLNSNNIWRFDSLKSDKYQKFLKVVVANKGIKYKDVNWNDYVEINNTNWVAILRIINLCVSSSDWTQLNSIKYSKMKAEIETTNEINLEEAVQTLPQPQSQSQPSANTNSSRNQRSTSTKNK